MNNFLHRRDHPPHNYSHCFFVFFFPFWNWCSFPPINTAGHKCAQSMRTLQNAFQQVGLMANLWSSSCNNMTRFSFLGERFFDSHRSLFQGCLTSYFHTSWKKKRKNPVILISFLSFLISNLTCDSSVINQFTIRSAFCIWRSMGQFDQVDVIYFNMRRTHVHV